MHSYKRKFCQDTEVEIEDSEAEIMPSQCSPKGKIRRMKRSSLKEWMKCDPDLQAFYSPKCRVSLFNRTNPVEEKDAELIAWSSSEDSDDLGTYQQPSQCITTCTQKSSPQHSQLISSFGSTFYGSIASTPNRKDDEVVESISPCIRLSSSSEIHISRDLFKPICPDFGEKSKTLQRFASVCEEAEISPPSSPIAALPGYHGTTWLQGIKWQSKTPEKFPEVEGVQLGSGKKKCLRGGLADQLQKLEARQKSFQNMWLHEQYQLGDSKALILKVLKVLCDKGLTKAKCDVLQDNDDPLVSPMGELRPGSTCKDQIRRVPWCESEGFISERRKEETFNQCTLLLSKNMNVPIQDVVVGSVLNVHPPMQKLWHPGTEETLIICPQFVEIVLPNCVASTPDDENEGEIRTSSSETSNLVFQWECPCRNGVCSADMCPLQS